MLVGLLTTAVRIFDVITFTFGAGLALAISFLKPAQRFRRYFLWAFTFMSLGVMSTTIEKIHASSPWNWTTTPFIFISAVLILITIIVAIHDHFK